MNWRLEQPKPLGGKNPRPHEVKTYAEFAAYCGVAKALRKCRELWNGGPVIVGAIVPEADRELYSRVLTAIAHAPRRRRSLTGSRDAQVISLENDRKRKKSCDAEIDEAMRDFERVVVVASHADMIPVPFQIASDAIVEVGPVHPRHVIAGAKLALNVSVSPDEAAFISTIPFSLTMSALRKGRSASDAIARMQKALAVQEKPAVGGPTLDDLHGLGEAGDWGRELAIDLADWRAGRIEWSDVERGILLSGAPGTGKTTFAGALARTCGVDIVTGSIASWQSRGHMGDMLKAMYGAFSEAKSKAPAILFIDEVDAIGDRETFHGEHVQYCTEVVNGFLECLDGVDDREGVVVVGACNHPDKLDAAVKRPGRLDRHVVIPLPDTVARVGILRWHTKGCLPDDQLLEVAERTEGFSGAALEQIVRQARRAARRCRRDMTLGDLLEELPALVPVPAESLWRTAIHEAGHSVVGLAVGRWNIVSAHVAAATPRNTGSVQAGGVEFSDVDDFLHASAEDYRARIMRCLGGLAAEEVFFGHRTDGGGGLVGSDLHSATVAAAAVEASLGLGSGLAYLSGLGSEDLLRLVQLDRVVRDRVEKTLAECFDRAREIVRSRRGDVERLAAALRDRGKLSGAEVREIVDAQPQLMLLPRAS